MNSNLQELNNLIECISSGEANIRKNAENKMMEIQTSSTTWKIYIDLLLVADDKILFFISKGLKYTLINYWYLLTDMDKKQISDALLTCLLLRGSQLAPYARSKLQQVVSELCFQNSNIGVLYSVLENTHCTSILRCLKESVVVKNDPSICQLPLASLCERVNSLVSYINDMNKHLTIFQLLYVAISTFVILIEDIGCTNSTNTTLLTLTNKNSSDHNNTAVAKNMPLSTKKQQLIENVLQYLPNVIELCCLSCEFSLNILNSNSNGTCQTRQNDIFNLCGTGLNCFKAIITSIPIGNHITNDLFCLLVNVAGSHVNGMHETKQYENMPSIAIDTLSELCWLKYLPNNSSNGTGTDGSISLLISLLTAMTEVMTSVRKNNPASEPEYGLEAVLPIPAIINFLTAFVNTHFSRCLKYVETTNNNSNMFIKPFQCLLEELLALTCVCKSNEVLTQLAALWTDIITQLYSYEGDLQCLSLMDPNYMYLWNNAAKYMLQQSLYSVNPLLMEGIDELQDDITINPYVDATIKQSMYKYTYGSDVGGANHDGSKSGQGQMENNMDEVDDGNCALALFKASSTLITSVFEFTNIHALASTVSETECIPYIIKDQFQKALQSAFSRNSNGNGTSNLCGILDASYLLPLLPMTNISSVDLMTQCLNCLPDERLLSGKLYVYFYVQCCHMMARLVSPVMIVPALNDNTYSMSYQSTDIIISSLYKHVEYLCEKYIITPVSSGVMIGTLSLLLYMFIQLDKHELLYVEYTTNNPNTMTNLITIRYKQSIAVLLDRMYAIFPNDLYCMLSGCAYFIQQNPCVSQMHYPFESEYLSNVVLGLENVGHLILTNISSGTVTNSTYVKFTRILLCIDSLVSLIQKSNSSSGHSSIRNAGRVKRHPGGLSYLHKKNQINTCCGRVPNIITTVVLSIYQHISVSIAQQYAASSSNTTVNTNAITRITLAEAHLSALHVVRTVLMTTSNLLIMGGKKAYGSLAQEIYTTGVSFLLTNATTAPLRDTTFYQIIICASNNMKCLQYVREVLSLGELIASTSGSQSQHSLEIANINSNVQMGFELLNLLSQDMSDPVLRSELLYDLLHMGWSMVKYYWRKELPNITASQSLPNSPQYRMNTEFDVSGSSNYLPGSNVQHIVEFMIQVFVSCLNTSGISPQDVYLCLDSVMYMGLERSLLSTPWFIHSCRKDLLNSCIRALVLDTHPSYSEMILELVQIVINASTETTMEYCQYIGQYVLLPLCAEQHCEQTCMTLITAYSEIISNSNAQSQKKLDMKHYSQYVISNLKHHILTSRTCL